MPAVIASVVGAVMMLLGLFLPWTNWDEIYENASIGFDPENTWLVGYKLVGGFERITVDGSSLVVLDNPFSDGIIFLILALAVAASGAAMITRNRMMAMISAVAGGLGFLLAIAEFFVFNSELGDLGSPGLGLWVTLAGSLIALIGGVLGLSKLKS